MKPLRSSTVLLKRLDRIQDRLQSLRLHSLDEQRAVGRSPPEGLLRPSGPAQLKLAAYKADSVKIVHAMLGEVNVCDDPGIAPYFYDYINRNQSLIG